MKKISFYSMVLFFAVGLLTTCVPEGGDGMGGNDMPFMPGEDPNVCNEKDLASLQYNYTPIACLRIHGVLVATLPNYAFDYANALDNREGYYLAFDGTQDPLNGSYSYLFVFDSDMNITRIETTDASSGDVIIVEYTYENGRLRSIQTPVGEPFDVETDERGNVLSVSKDGNIFATYTYNTSVANPFYKSACMLDPYFYTPFIHHAMCPNVMLGASTDVQPTFVARIVETDDLNRPTALFVNLPNIESRENRMHYEYTCNE